MSLRSLGGRVTDSGVDGGSGRSDGDGSSPGPWARQEKRYGPGSTWDAVGGLRATMNANVINLRHLYLYEI